MSFPQMLKPAPRRANLGRRADLEVLKCILRGLATRKSLPFKWLLRAGSGRERYRSGAILTDARFATLSLMKATVEEIEKDPATYLHRVLEGETVVVFQKERAVAEIKPIEIASLPRPFGLAAGDFVVPDEFDDPPPDELLAQFEGK